MATVIVFDFLVRMRTETRQQRRYFSLKWLVVMTNVLFYMSFGVLAQVRNMTAEEVAALPEYCLHATAFVGLYGTKEGQAHWKQRFGESAYSGIHHYCWALLHIRRAQGSRLSELDKRGHYNSAVNDIAYTLRHAPNDFVLLPEILSRRADALMYLKRFREAESDLRRAISLREDYWPAYEKLASNFLKQGNNNGAREVLKIGISKVSEPRALQRMLDQLDGGKRQ